MIALTIIAIIAGAEFGVIVYMLGKIRASETPLEPPYISQHAKNKIHGYHIERFGEEAYRDEHLHKG